MTLKDHLMNEAIEMQKQSNLKGKKHLKAFYANIRLKYDRFSDKEKADCRKEWNHGEI